MTVLMKISNYFLMSFVVLSFVLSPISSNLAYGEVSQLNGLIQKIQGGNDSSLTHDDIEQLENKISQAQDSMDRIAEKLEKKKISKSAFTKLIDKGLVNFQRKLTKKIDRMSVKKAERWVNKSKSKLVAFPEGAKKVQLTALLNNKGLTAKEKLRILQGNGLAEKAGKQLKSKLEHSQSPELMVKQVNEELQIAKDHYHREASIKKSEVSRSIAQDSGIYIGVSLLTLLIILLIVCLIVVISGPIGIVVSTAFAWWILGITGGVFIIPMIIFIVA